jgi:hypothetical protein
MRRLFIVVLLSVLAGGVAGQPSIAQTSSDIKSHYTILPRVSTLEQSPRFLEIPTKLYPVRGNYDVVRLALPPAGVKFANSDVVALQPSPTPTTAAFVLDVDQIFNMDGLTGKRLPVASIFDVYQFKGTNAFGDAVNMYASLFGPWMYMRGATESPSTSSDAFTYQLHALARTGPFSDLNGDGIVDAGDYVFMRKFGSATAADAAAGASFTDWRNDFGNALPDLAAIDAQLNTALGTSVGTAPVPEPSALTLLAISALLVTKRKRRA